MEQERSDAPEPRPGDPDLRALASRHRAELRAEAEAYEELAARDRLRTRTLGDVAAEMMARGDRVAVRGVSGSFTGVVTYTAGDLACLRTVSGDVDVNLGAPLMLQVVERATTGGIERGRGPSTFAARLAEHEAAASRVEIGLRTGGDHIGGVITAAALDHVVVDLDGRPCYVARDAIEYVIGLRP